MAVSRLFERLFRGSSPHMKPPTDVPHVNVYIGITDKRAVKDVVRQIHPGYADRGISCRQLSGGLSNVLWRCKPRRRSAGPEDGGIPDPVLVRVFGRGSSQLINRTEETAKLKSLRELGFPLAVHGTFENGRVEHFVGGRPLTLAEMSSKRFSRKIGEAMSRLHALDVRHTQPSGSAPPELFDDTSPRLWGTLDSWMQLLRQMCENQPPSPHNERVRTRLDTITQELEWLQEELAALRFQALPPVVFCHMDVQALNLIFDAELDEVNFIDYEYASWNYRALDIANHFCEYAGFTPMDMTLLPTKSRRLKFIKHYLQSSYRHNEMEVPDNNQLRELSMQLLRDVDRFTMASHLFWSVWGHAQTELVQDIESKEDEFNYNEYCKRRLSLYFLQKESLQAKGRLSLPF